MVDTLYSTASISFIYTLYTFVYLSTHNVQHSFEFFHIHIVHVRLLVYTHCAYTGSITCIYTSYRFDDLPIKFIIERELEQHSNLSQTNMFTYKVVCEQQLVDLMNVHPVKEELILEQVDLTSVTIIYMANNSCDVTHLNFGVCHHHTYSSLLTS